MNPKDQIMSMGYDVLNENFDKFDEVSLLD